MNQPHKKHDHSGSKLIVRILAILLAALFVMMLGSEIFLFAFADEVDEIETLKAQQTALQEEQEECQEKLDALADEKENAVNAYLLLSRQNEALADQIDATTALISSYDERINDASAQLTAAQTEKEAYFDTFCARVSQMEQGGSISVWETIFSATSLTELLTSLYDMQTILRYDSDTMTQLDKAEQLVADAEETLETQRAQQAEQLKALKTEQEELQENEAQAADTLEEIKNNQSLYASQLSAVSVRCKDLEDDILQAETMQAKAQAIALRAPDMEEDREEEAQPESEQDAEEPVEEETQDEAEITDSAAETELAAPASEAEQEPEETATDTSSAVSGSDVVAYALQFVGNPYVWGGTSLTNGCDCSGFVMSVYAHFGYSLPHFSGSLRYCGTGVSYEEAQAGDIICYDGHVGIYMGGGQMVNAFDSAHGIIICSVNQQRLIAVRRIL